MLADTLVILPTIGANVSPARRILNAINAEPHNYDIMLILDAPDPQRPVDWESHATIVRVNPERRGLVAATNDGFAHFLAGPWSHLVILEDGLTLTPGWDTALRRMLDAHPDFGWVACGQVENDRAPFTAFCSMMTRACAEKVRGLDPIFSPCQFDDGDLFLRCVQAGFRPHAVAHKVHHPESRTSREGTVEDDWRLIEEHRVLFHARWGLRDFHWSAVPVHRGCDACA